MLQTTEKVMMPTLDLLRGLYHSFTEHKVDNLKKLVYVKSFSGYPYWVAVGDDSQAGGAMGFDESYTLHSDLDPGWLKGMIGLPLTDVAEELFHSDNFHAQSIGIAILNAISLPFMGRIRLEQRDIYAVFDRELPFLIKPEDVVTVVGHSHFMAGFLARHRIHVHTLDMRDKSDLCSLIIDKSTCDYVPMPGTQVHGVEEGADLLANSNVVFITASSLCNNTFLDLLEKSKHCREICIWGNSAAFIPDVLFKMGVTYSEPGSKHLCGYKFLDQFAESYDGFNVVPYHIEPEEFVSQFISYRPIDLLEPLSQQ